MRFSRSSSPVLLMLAGWIGLLLPFGCLAAAFGSVRGTVHDVRQRPAAGATVQLVSNGSEPTLTARTDSRGRFGFAAVALGTYELRVRQSGYQPAARVLFVTSDASSQVDVPLLPVPSLGTVTVQAPVVTAAFTATPTTLVERHTIERTPGASLTNSLAMITDYVPGAYVVHDQLHVRGGHQISWQVDGVEIPNTSISSNLAPLIDPRDIATLAVGRGSYQADEGDRTYGVLDVLPRSGWSSDRRGELIGSGGSFGQTDDYASVAGHSEHRAWFASLNANRSELGLMTPSPQVLHDRRDGFGAFANLDDNVGAREQLRLVSSARHDDYQIPNLPGEANDDVQRETDGFALLSWQHTEDAAVALTTSLLFHYNRADLDAGRADEPLSASDRRASTYIGGEERARFDLGRHTVRAGLFGYRERDREQFGLLFQSGALPPVAQTLDSSGKLLAAFIGDTFQATRRLQLQLGLRRTWFSAARAEAATDPRLGFTFRLPAVSWVLRGFYGSFYQSPPPQTLAGPLLTYVRLNNLGVIPLHGERDHEWQVGIDVPVRGWRIDVDHFRTRASNYFDHNPIGNSNLFLPMTIQGARIEATELSVRSPSLWGVAQVHVTWSNQTADGIGAISGGLTDFSPPSGTFALDHDQRNTLDAGSQINLPRHSYLATNLYYGSGFANGADGIGPSHLPSHVEVDLMVGKAFSKHLEVTLTALNLANQHLLIDNSFTFDGLHYNSPRQLYAAVHYCFGY